MPLPHLIVPAPNRLAFRLGVLGLKCRFEVTTKDGSPLEVDDLLAAVAVLEAYDVEHGLPVSEAEAARQEARARALLGQGPPPGPQPPFPSNHPDEVS